MGDSLNNFPNGGGGGKTEFTGVGMGRGTPGFWHGSAVTSFLTLSKGMGNAAGESRAGGGVSELEPGDCYEDTYEAEQELNAHRTPDAEEGEDRVDFKGRGYDQNNEGFGGPPPSSQDARNTKNGASTSLEDNRKPAKAHYDPKVSQQKRREELLSSQKQRRDEILEKIRQLETDSACSDSEFEEDENFAKLVERNKRKRGEDANEDEIEAMEAAGNARKRSDFRPARRNNWSQKNRRAPCSVMMSEWLVEKPEDFEDNWMGVFCPVGKRCLVVTSRGKTFVYSRRHEYMGVFQSMLPGGRKLNPRDPESNRKKGVTILDCIWSEQAEVFYVLDLICWNSYSCNNCDKAYRQFFQTSKFEENPELFQRALSNPFPFLPLPSFSCDQLENVMMTTLPIFKEKIDGVLFFHKDSFYFNTVNPLVLWIYLTTVEEQLQVPVSPELVGLQKSHQKREQRKMANANDNWRATD